MGYKVTVLQWNEQRCLGALRWKGCALSAQFLIGGSNVGVLNLPSGKEMNKDVQELPWLPLPRPPETEFLSV